jgi:hypothetical protein
VIAIKNFVVGFTAITVSGGILAGSWILAAGAGEGTVCIIGLLAAPVAFFGIMEHIERG